MTRSRNLTLALLVIAFAQLMVEVQALPDAA